MAEVTRRTLLQLGISGAGLLMSPLGFSKKPTTAAGPDLRQSHLLADGWRFHLGHASDLSKDFGFGRNQRTYAKAGAMTADAAYAAFDDANWNDIRVPHDWAVSLPFAIPSAPAPEKTADAVAAHGFKAIGRDHPQHSVGWYRRFLDISAADRNRSIWLEFDGVFRDCLVFVNGYIVGRNESGYAPFRVDIGDFLDYQGGPNLLAVRVDASLGEGWFYEGAGIYRNVKLVKASTVHIPQWGTFVRTEIGADGARIRTSVEVKNESGAAAQVTLQQRIASPNGAIVASFSGVLLSLAVNERKSVDSDVLLKMPALWSIKTPQLHTLISELSIDGKIVDRYQTPFGIRKIRFDAEHGFFLNDEPVKLMGTCNHQDHAGVGTAIPDRLNAWRIEQVQSMGSNAWRSAHNPPSEALLDICDAKGMLMINEARLNSTDPEAIDQLERIVRRDRNHPCIILWSVGNEEPHQGTERGANISKEMIQKIQTLDATRPTTQAFDNSFDQGASRVVDVIGFNYRIDQIPGFHARFPNQAVIGSETGSTVATRGEYRNDPDRHIVRAYDSEHPWWASTAESWWPIVADNDYIAGGFIWTGFDYRGEPTPFPQWPSVSSYFGVLDLCGFPKDNYWYYRAWWKPQEPMVHLLPHWTWPGRDGEAIDVWAYGNSEEIELLLNGRSLGRKKMARNRHVSWSVPYAPGVIEALGFTGGKRVAETRRVTAGAAYAVNLSADRRRLTSDGRDVSMLTAEIVDKKGNPVPHGNALIRFSLSGPGRIIGVGNGDPTSHEPDQAMQRSAFNGLCQAILQTDPTMGSIKITAQADGLKAGAATLISLPPS
jgi:beta-galactosidase